MNTREQLVQSTLREVFHDPTILYDKSHFAGGLTNYNYIMRIRGKLYIIREPGVMTEQMLNRPAEQANNVIASELGINSVCVYFDEHSHTFAALDPSSSECLRNVAALLKTDRKSVV